MLKTLTNTLNIVFITVLLGVSGLFVATLFPLPGNIEAKIVQSGSMAPAIPVGALVVIKPSPSYGVGDVITFGADTKTNIPTTHRIVSLQSSQERGGETLYRVQGDANEEPDSELVPHREIIGKVLLTAPYVGFVLDFARQPVGFALLIGLPALMIIIDELVNIFVEVRRLRKKPARRRPALEKTVWLSPEGDPRTFSKVQVGTAKAFEDIRVVYTRRRVSEDMFVRSRQSVLVFLAAFGLSASLLVGSVGSTFSYFTDIERSLSNLLRAGSGWELEQERTVAGGVVLNEFLPNPDVAANGLNFGDDSADMPLGEWVELYNNADVPEDLTGWYLWDGSGSEVNKVLIAGSNTNTGTTIIPANGWLVVYFNKAVLNNNGDTVSLFDPENTLVDSYSYSAAAPANKSYARIPDGTGAWVDPVPTPGGPNTLDAGAAYEEFLTDSSASDVTEPAEAAELPVETGNAASAEETADAPAAEPAQDPQTEPAGEEPAIEEPAIEEPAIEEPVQEADLPQESSGELEDEPAAAPESQSEETPTPEDVN